jgi:hypothetical protein
MLCENNRFTTESDSVLPSLSLSRRDTAAQYGAAEVIFTIVKTHFQAVTEKCNSTSVGKYENLEK